MSDKLTMSVKEAAEELGIGLGNMYEIARRPDFPAAIKIGERTRILRDSMMKWLEDKAKKKEEV